MADFLTALGFLVAGVGLLLAVVSFFVKEQRIFVPLATVTLGLSLGIAGLWINGYRSFVDVVEVLREGRLPRSRPMPDARELHARLSGNQTYESPAALDALAKDFERLLELKRIGDEYWPAMRLYETMHDDLSRTQGDFWPELPGSANVVIQETWVRPPDLQPLSADELARARELRRQHEESEARSVSKRRATSTREEQRRIEKSKAVLRGHRETDLATRERPGIAPWHREYSRATRATKQSLGGVIAALRDPGQSGHLGERCRQLKGAVGAIPRTALEAPDKEVRLSLKQAYAAIDRMALACLEGEMGLVETYLQQSEQFLGAAAAALRPHGLAP